MFSYLFEKTKQSERMHHISFVNVLLRLCCSYETYQEATRACVNDPWLVCEKTKAKKAMQRAHAEKQVTSVEHMVPLKETTGTLHVAKCMYLLSAGAGGHF